MNVTETQTQTAFEPLRCHSLIVPFFFFFSLTGRKKPKTNIKPFPCTDPTFIKKKKERKKEKTLRFSRGAPSSLLTRPFLLLVFFFTFNTAHCANKLSSASPNNNQGRKEKSEILPPAIFLATRRRRHSDTLWLLAAA